jgi:hypothetical protein
LARLKIFSWLGTPQLVTRRTLGPGCWTGSGGLRAVTRKAHENMITGPTCETAETQLHCAGGGGLWQTTGGREFERSGSNVAVALNTSGGCGRNSCRNLAVFKFKSCGGLKCFSYHSLRKSYFA